MNKFIPDNADHRTSLKSVLFTHSFRTRLLCSFMSCLSLFLSQGSLSELGKLLMQGSFSVWTEHKKGHAKVKDLARFKPMQRHLFLHEKALLFCKRREENGEGYEKAPSYSFKQSLSVSSSTTSSDFYPPLLLTPFCFSVWLGSRWTLWVLLRMQRETTKSLKFGATPEKRSISFR